MTKLAAIDKGQDAKTVHPSIDQAEVVAQKRALRQVIPAQQPILPNRQCSTPDFNLTKWTDFPSVSSPRCVRPFAPRAFFAR